MLSEEKPIIMGVCYRHAKDLGISVETFRVLTILAGIFVGPALMIYVIIGLIETLQPSNTQEQYKSSDVNFNVTDTSQKEDIFAQPKTSEEEVSFDVEPTYQENSVSDNSIVINGVRGEEAVVNGVREY